MAEHLELHIDLEAVLQEYGQQIQGLQKELEAGVQALAASTHAHVLERAAEKLHSRHETFVKACSFDQIAPNVWAITVKKEALWIEDGLSEHSLLPDLLNSPKAKVSKDGNKYISIPFKHNKGGSKQTVEAKSITDKLRAELKSRKVPYQKIERNPDGSPKTGLLHSLDLGGPQRGATAHNAAWSSPALDGVRIYQRLTKSANGRQSVQRDLVTFRTASSKHLGQKWNYPGIEGVKLLDEAFKWASEEWSKEVLPSILKKFGFS